MLDKKQASKTAFCSECDTDLTHLDIPSLERIPCPKCGSKNRTFDVEIREEIGVSSFWGYKYKQKKLSGKKKASYEEVGGDSYFKTENRWVKIKRIFDRVKDWYSEVVYDGKTRKIIHYCGERLSDHFGHGSDKKTRR